MNIESQILQNQTEMLKEMGEVKQDIGEINGTLSRLIPQINGLEQEQNEFVKRKSVRVWLGIIGGIVIPGTALITKLKGLW